VKQQYARSALRLETGFENMHREAVDVGDDTRTDTWRQRGVAIRGKIRPV
jgi:hypothetical protein